MNLPCRQCGGPSPARVVVLEVLELVLEEEVVVLLLLR